LEEVVEAGDILVDGQLVGDVSLLVLKDRQQMSQDGFIVAVVPVNSRNQLAGEPEIISRGFVAANGSKALLQRARNEIKRHYQNGASVAPETLRGALEEFFYRETQSRPVVLPSFVKVQQAQHPAQQSAKALAPKLRQVRPMRVKQIV
jgi:ribonuclease J